MVVPTRRNAFKQAKELLGLADDFEIRGEEDYQFALRVWKDKTVLARQLDDQAAAAVLSQAKEILKRRHTSRISRVCPNCGEPKSQNCRFCRTCYHDERWHKHSLHTHSVTMKENEVEDGLSVIPPKAHANGAIANVCRKLLAGQIGDSFVTDRPPSTINNVCRNLSLQIIVRTINPAEKDKKKKRWRVWRSDGMEMEKVNEIIRSRMVNPET
jgi:hypothetical protein